MKGPELVVNEIGRGQYTFHGWCVEKDDTVRAKSVLLGVGKGQTKEAKYCTSESICECESA